MLLPTKGISAERALLTLGSDLLSLLDRPASVSVLWDSFANEKKKGRERTTFDWFSLALAALFAMGLVEWTASGQLKRRPHVSP